MADHDREDAAADARSEDCLCFNECVCGKRYRFTKVPKEDFELLVRAYKDRKSGKIKVTSELDALFTRWIECFK